MVKGMQEVMDVMEKVKGDLAAQGGLKQVIFVACGGSFASSYPARYLLGQESSLKVLGYNSSEFVNATPKTVGPGTLVIATSTKATAETVEALKVAKAKGAVTVGLSGYADSLTAQTADYYITYYHADEWYQDPSLVHCNSQGTALKIAFWLLKEMCIRDRSYFTDAGTTVNVVDDSTVEFVLAAPCEIGRASCRDRV